MTTKQYYYWVGASADDNTSVDSGHRTATSARQAADDEAAERRGNPECIGEVVYVRDENVSDTAYCTV